MSLRPPKEIDSFRDRKFREALAQDYQTLQEVTTDPASAEAGDVWVLFSGGTYQLSFRTLAGSTKRVTLT